jgi:hypothetical protein
MAVEVVYLGHDNSIDLLLKADGVAYDLANTTQINLTIGGTTITSINGNTDPIKWYRAGYDTGEMRMFLGDQDIDPGTYRRAWIVVFDYDNNEGIVWGNIRITVKAEVEES